jgi:cyclophilin family peptidyl-prolyl cis-trans isomerase
MQLNRFTQSLFVPCFDHTGKGNPGWTLPDETFAVTHTEAGLVGMATCGEPHTASTQFYIVSVVCINSLCSRSSQLDMLGSRCRTPVSAWFTPSDHNERCQVHHAEAPTSIHLNTASDAPPFPSTDPESSQVA